MRQGVTYQLTQGVTKNIIPAIASTNAIVAAACTLEALKTVTMCSTGMNNYMMWAPRLVPTLPSHTPIAAQWGSNPTEKWRSTSYDALLSGWQVFRG